ncbi:unnamed protein product, partial [Prorocentrum cordatum]
MENRFCCATALGWRCLDCRLAVQGADGQVQRCRVTLTHRLFGKMGGRCLEALAQLKAVLERYQIESASSVVPEYLLGYLTRDPAKDAGSSTVDELRATLAAGAHPGATDAAGWSALMVAAQTGDLEAVRVLAKRDPDILKHRNRRGQSALMWCLFRRNRELEDRTPEPRGHDHRGGPGGPGAAAEHPAGGEGPGGQHHALAPRRAGGAPRGRRGGGQGPAADRRGPDEPQVGGSFPPSAVGVLEGEGGVEAFVLERTDGTLAGRLPGAEEALRAGDRGAVFGALRDHSRGLRATVAEAPGALSRARAQHAPPGAAPGVLCGALALLPRGGQWLRFGAAERAGPWQFDFRAQQGEQILEVHFDQRGRCIDATTGPIRFAGIEGVGTLGLDWDASHTGGQGLEAWLLDSLEQAWQAEWQRRQPRPPQRDLLEWSDGSSMRGLVESAKLFTLTKVAEGVPASPRTIFALHVHLMRSRICSECTRAMLGCDPRLQRLWRPYVGHILGALRELPFYQGIVYRGIAVEDLASLASGAPASVASFLDGHGGIDVGKELRWRGFTAATRDPRVAMSLISAGRRGASAAQVTRARVWAGDAVEAVMFEYERGQRRLFGQASCNERNAWEVPRGEQIVRVHWRSAGEGSGCSFETSAGTLSPWYGAQDGEVQTLAASDGCHITGLTLPGASARGAPPGLEEAPQGLPVILTVSGAGAAEANGLFELRHGAPPGPQEGQAGKPYYWARSDSSGTIIRYEAARK